MFTSFPWDVWNYKKQNLCYVIATITTKSKNEEGQKDKKKEEDEEEELQQASAWIISPCCEAVVYSMWESNYVK